jgi:penicillin-insensitive murein endopeptidase
MRKAAVLAVLGASVAAGPALAGPAPKKAPAQPPAPNSVLPMGRSVGSPTDGRLEGGAHLAETPYLRILPAYAGMDVRWGLGALVGLLDRAARAVRRQFPDAVLSVGHLSRAGGGDLDRHASHESGRDADVAFYVKNQRGQPIQQERFVRFLGDGTAPTWPGASFDDARNWALVAALLSDPAAHVSHIFVSSPLRARLLAYAARSGAPVALRERAALTLAQPHGSLPHDDHFHVRISCPAGMKGCVENPAFRIAKAKAKPSAPALAKGAPSRPAPASKPASAAAKTAPPSPTKEPPPDRKEPARAETAPGPETDEIDVPLPATLAVPVAPTDDAD